jgi:hypothetical protein
VKTSDRAAEIVGWAMRRFKGHPMITAIMMLVLRHLKAAQDQDWEWIELPDYVHPATTKALLDRDWIVEASANGHTRYGLTKRGERYLRLYECPREKRHSDGLCPTCRERPRHVYASGLVAGYCYQCEKTYRKALRKMGRPQKKVGRLCSKCRTRTAHVHPSGKAATYCKVCISEKRREWRRDRNKRWRARIDAGDPPLCFKCKAAPVHYTAKSVYDMCEGCLLEYWTAYNRKRRGEPYLRFDGICPRCGRRPKHVTANGRVQGYCTACKREYQREYYRQKRERKNDGNKRYHFTRART